MTTDRKAALEAAKAAVSLYDYAVSKIDTASQPYPSKYVTIDVDHLRALTSHKPESVTVDGELLAYALTILLEDLKDRAKWMVFHPSKDGLTLPCGAGAYEQAKRALDDYRAVKGAE